MGKVRVGFLGSGVAAAASASRADDGNLTIVISSQTFMKKLERRLCHGNTASCQSSGASQRNALQQRSCFGWFGLVLFNLWVGLPSLFAFSLLSSDELVFVNLDHAPMGVCSTITYGTKASVCGVGTSTGVFPYYVGGGGVLVGLSTSSGLKLLPFAASAASFSINASFFPDASIQRSVTPCTDEFTVAASGLSFMHYTPAWLMSDLDSASLSEKQRCFLPATWMVFTIQNTNSVPEEFYFGLPVPSTQRTFANGAYQGFVLGEAALAVQSGSCELLSGAGLTEVFSGMTNGFAFQVSVPAGQTRSLMVVLAYYRSAVVDTRINASYYYTSLFPSMDGVIDAAFAGFGNAQTRCQQLALVMNQAGMNPYRQFLASHALHSYMANTACLIDLQGRVYWREVEGYFNYINTLDLTPDHAFFDSHMHPWALRNVLDAFSGALASPGYTYATPLFDARSNTQVSSLGFSFHHDMGLWPNSGTGPAYGVNMGLEELQSWILSAGLYWSRTGDRVWLTNNAALLQTCLNSLLLRDDTNSGARDGVTQNVNAGEITTYDNLDASLQKPAFSGRMTVRNWASYLALNAMFAQIGDAADAATCETMAAVAAQTIVDRWNSYRGTLGYIPARLDGSNTAATTPIIEGLAYPAAMGLTNAMDRTGGPYASMLQALSNHTAAVLIPGKCIGVPSGGWLMTSANIITWQSKVFICQYVAETVLGITNDLVNGAVDQVHTTIQILTGPSQGFVDAVDGTGGYHFGGGPHYPRAITTSLWWLNPANNPSNPVPASAPPVPATLAALATDHQVLLLWQGVAHATRYNLKRAIAEGGPYEPLANGLAGASFTDSGLVNGATYYYILTASNQLGESSPSAPVSATPYGPLPSTGTNLTASVAGSQFLVSWPSTHVGWILQTNVSNLAPGAWADVPGSFTNWQMTFPTSDPTIPSKFFRLRHP